jgi:uroporphyrinogen decarboxylase
MRNKRQSVIDAVKHRDTAGAASGKVPYSIVMTGDGFTAYGDRLMADYPNPKVKADLDAHLIDYQQAVALSIGNNLVYVSPPWWNYHNIDRAFSAEDTPTSLPSVIGRGDYTAFFNQCKYIKENYDVYILAVIFGSHFEKAYFSRGIEKFLYDLAADPVWSQKLLDMIIRKNIVMLENFLAYDCIDGVLLGSDWGTQRGLIMSPTCWRSMILNGERQEYDLVHSYGKDLWVHSCGKIDPILGDLCDIQMDVLNPVQPECMDIKELKTTYGSRIAFYGGISTQKTLPYGTAAEVAAETEYTIKLMSENGGYITAPSQEIQTDVPYENLRALIDTAKKFSE